MIPKQFNILNSWPFLLGLVLGLYFITLNVTGINLTYFPGDLGDGRFNIYILEHAHQYFGGNLESFWSAPFMYPEKEIITFSDNLLGTAPLYSLFRIFGADIFTAFQLWFIAITILNYSSCYLFLNWLLKNRYAAVLGAFVFAFSIALQSQMTHAQTFPRFFIPIAIWMTLLFFQNLKSTYFFLALFFTVLQFYSGMYLGFMLIIPLFFLSIILILKYRKELFREIKKIRWVLSILFALIVNALLLAKLMTPYYYRSLQVGENQFENIIESIPQFKSFIFCQPGSPIWDFLTGIGSEMNASWDHHIFAGGIALTSLIAFSVIIVFRKKLKLNSILPSNVKWLALVALLTFVFTVRINEFTLYRLFYNFPGFGSMRSITRIINIELLFFGLAVSFVSFLIFQKFLKYKTPIFIVLLALLTFDNYFMEGKSYRTGKKVAQNRLESLQSKMENIPKDAIVSYETSNRYYPVHWYQLDAMLATQSLGLKSVNGYSGNSPVGYQLFWAEMNEEARIKWFESMNFNPKKVYVIH